MSRGAIINRIALVLLVAALLAVPILLPMLKASFWVNIITEILIWSLLAASVNLLLGYVGLLSFGQALYFGVGMYGAMHAKCSANNRNRGFRNTARQKYISRTIVNRIVNNCA